MPNIQRVTGMQDVLPDERRYWDWVLTEAVRLAERYGFKRLDTPIIEYTELFTRGMGTASDVFVQKEMYTIEEPDGSSITLRPEFTAGVVRAYLENGMANWTQPVKLFSTGPIFRRERPQAGRYRQHSQFNAEILGETDPATDLEIMMLCMNLYHAVGYRDLIFQLNSTGCPECRPAYLKLFKSYLNRHADRLAPIDKERLQKNALRVLDSKEPGMDALLADAPHISDHLCEDCATHFADLRGMLEAIRAPYKINFRLVRGIDYYTKTAFEVWAEGIGAQAALVGGGRYDGLAEAIGGAPTPGVGFGSGIERIVLGLRERELEPPGVQEPSLMVLHFGGETKLAAVQLTYRLRDAGLGVQLAFARGRRSMKSQMREANSRDVRFALIVGEDEVKAEEVTVRSLEDGEQVRVPLRDIVSWFHR